jgi:hypothetical protein
MAAGQRLKPHWLPERNGTAKAVPYKTKFHRSEEADWIKATIQSGSDVSKAFVGCL